MANMDEIRAIGRHRRGVGGHAHAARTVGCIALAGLVALSLGVPRSMAALDTKAVDTLVRGAMATWQVPGLAVAAVKDGRVVLLKAYGVSDVDSQAPVTTRTLFATGSITKSFTATVMAMLAADGRLDWDKPVAAQLPDFRLIDAAASSLVTPRDLVSHRSGLPRHDVLWYVGAFDRREMVRRLRHLRLTKRPREAFQYNNLMFMTAGYLAGHADGREWEKLTRDRLLRPLGMSATRLRFVPFLSAPDMASPYFGALEGRVPIAARNTDEIGPAASVYSHIEDMTRYLRFHLDDGTFAGTRLLSEARVRELRSPQIEIPRGRRFDELGAVSYGMGFYISAYRGRKLVFHPGFIDGYGSQLAMLPDDGIGIVVLTNLSGHNPVPKIVARLLYDRLLGLEPAPWLARFRDIEEARKRRREMRAAATATPDVEVATARSPPEPRPKPRPVGDFAGTYDHPGYGPIQIRAAGGALIGRFHHRVFPLVRTGVDSWRVKETVWPLRGGLRMTFRAGPDGKIDRLATPLADGPTYPYKVGDVVFVKSAAAPARPDGN